MPIKPDPKRVHELQVGAGIGSTYARQVAIAEARAAALFALRHRIENLCTRDDFDCDLRDTLRAIADLLET